MTWAVPPADLASTRIAAPAAAVFDLISRADALSRWSFGTWETVLHDGGLIEGQAYGTGARVWLRLDPVPERLMVDYHLGATPEALVPRIFARLVPGQVTGHRSETCTLLLCALRTEGMTEDRWQQLHRAHAFETDLIRSLAEHAHGE